MKPFGKIGTAGCKLTSEEKERYLRQLILFENGEQGQLALKHSAVLVVGAGGLGSIVLPYLAGAGVGRIGIVDNDLVSLSNLQRQVLYETSQINCSKVEHSKERLEKLNPNTRIDIHHTRFTEENGMEIMKPYDLIIDCTDNISSRYIIDNLSRETGKPFVYGSLCEYTGQISIFNYHNGPSYSDVYPYSPDAENFTQPLGVFGAMAGIIGSIQAMEAIKILIGAKNTLSGQLLLINMDDYSFRKIHIR